jgi:hypothetical protein
MRMLGMQPTMPLEELQRSLTRIIETAPALSDSGPIPPDYMKWAADANALIVATGYFSLVPEAQVAINGLSFANRVTKREQLMMILHKARSQIELEMQQSGAGPPTGANGPAISHNTYLHGLNLPSAPTPVSGNITAANWSPPLSQPTARPTPPIEELTSPYYREDPRTSGMDPRTSNLGFRPQPPSAPLGSPAALIQTAILDPISADSIAQRIAADPGLYSNLATNAAQQIRVAIGDLDARKPNEPDALSGYEHVNVVLTNLATDLETIATRIEGASKEVVPETKKARLREAGEIFLKTYDGFAGWCSENATTAGRVIAHIGLAGTISGLLSYFAGVPPMIAFPVTIGALNGENVWEVIKLFAPNKSKDDKGKNQPA